MYTFNVCLVSKTWCFFFSFHPKAGKIITFWGLAPLRHGTKLLRIIRMCYEHTVMVFNFRKFLLYDVKLLTMGLGTNFKSTSP